MPLLASMARAPRFTIAATFLVTSADLPSGRSPYAALRMVTFPGAGRASRAQTAASATSAAPISAADSARRSRSNTLTMELFLKKRGGEESCFERHEEVHVQHALDLEPVRKVTLESGFESVVAFDVQSLAPAKPATAKAVFVARKGS